MNRLVFLFRLIPILALLTGTAAIFGLSRPAFRITGSKVGPRLRLSNAIPGRHSLKNS